jgi:hypothetical protein
VWALSVVWAVCLSINVNAAQVSPSAAWPFEENGGRYPAEVAYAGRASTGRVFVTNDGKVVHALERKKDKERWTLVETLEGATGRPQGGEVSPVAISRFHGKQLGRLRAFETLRMPVAKGIEGELRLREGGIERLFEIAPGASAERIRVRLDGAKRVQVLRDGSLEIATGIGPLRLSRPIAWQLDGERRVPVDVKYSARANTYSFVLGAYDRNKKVYIDPLLQSTYVGGTGSEGVFGAAAGTDRIYVSGGTDGGFPGTAGGAQPAVAPGNSSPESDVYVAAFSLDLTTLIAATYYGGSSTDFGSALAVTEDAIYVAGQTDSSDLPGTGTGAVPAYGGGSGRDGFIARLSLDLTTLVRATYFGGNADDFISGIRVFGNSIYAGGATASAAIPGTAGAADPSLTGPTDAFIARFSTDLTTLQRSTYLGGSQYDGTSGNPVINATGVYVVGTTDSHDFPSTAGGLQPTLNPADTSNAAFVSHLSSDLTQIIQSTYYASTFAHISGFAIEEGFGDLFIMGRGAGSMLPGVAGGAQPTPGGGFTDLWVARITPSLATVVNASYYGGTDEEEPYFNTLLIANGSVYIAGASDSPSLPNTASGIQPAKAGPTPDNADAFVARFSPDLATIQQATWFGDDFNESATALVASASGVIYLAGGEDSSGLPGAAGGAIDDYAGGDFDGYLTALSADLAVVSPTPTVSISDFSAAEGNAGSTLFTFTVTLSSAPGSNATVTVQTVNGSAVAPVDFLSVPPTTLTFTPFGPLTRQVTVQVAGDFGVEPDEQFTVTLTNPSGVTIADGTGVGTIEDDDATVIPADAVPTLSPAMLFALLATLAVAAIVMMRR